MCQSPICAGPKAHFKSIGGRKILCSTWTYSGKTEIPIMEGNNEGVAHEVGKALLRSVQMFNT